MKQSLSGKRFISKCGLLWQIMMISIIMIRSKGADSHEGAEQNKTNNMSNSFSHAEVRDKVEELLELEVCTHVVVWRLCVCAHTHTHRLTVYVVVWLLIDDLCMFFRPACSLNGTPSSTVSMKVCMQEPDGRQNSKRIALVSRCRSQTEAVESESASSLLHDVN